MWLFMTMRLSMSSLAGMVRTLVAVGTVRLVTMLVASDFAMPRSGTTLSCLTGSESSTTTACGLVTGASAGTGAGLGALEVVRAVGWFSVTGTGAAVGVAAGTAATGATGAGVAGGADAAGAADCAAAGAFAVWW